MTHHNKMITFHIFVKLTLSYEISGISSSPSAFFNGDLKVKQLTNTVFGFNILSTSCHCIDLINHCQMINFQDLISIQKWPSNIL